jgi:hypothetical protein
MRFTFRKLRHYAYGVNIAVIVVALLIFGLTTSGKIAQADPPTMESWNDTHLVKGEWTQTIKANPKEAQLDAVMQARVAHVAATMTPKERAGLTVGVQAMQARMRTGTFDTPKFLAQLKERGATDVASLSRDPIAAVTIPVRFEYDAPSTDRKVNETMFTDEKTGRKYGFSNAGGDPCGWWHTTDPYITMSTYASAGNRLSTVRFIKTWCSRYDYNGLYPTGIITIAPHWEPPNVSFTNWCVGCSWEVTWHDQWWYAWSGAYPYTVEPSWTSGFAIRFTGVMKQCIGYVIAQCFAPKNFNWGLNLHGDARGTFDAIT